MADVRFTEEAKVKNYPPELLDKRHMIEGNMIACLWKNPELYNDLKELTKEDFVTEDGRSYYLIGKAMYDNGFRVYDPITVNTFIADKPAVAPFVNMSAISQMMALVDLENVEAYYDEIVKSNILLRLHEKGFQVVKDMTKFNAMTSELVYQHFDYHLNDVFVKKQLGVKTIDLAVDYDKFLQDCHAGKNLGMPFNSMPILNYNFGGIHRRNMLLHTAHSGVGKTSSAIVFYILPLLEAGEKVLVIANEQGESDWRTLMIPTVISNKLHYNKFHRQRMQYGNFSAEEWEVLGEAKNWLGKYKGNLEFVQLFDYSISTIKKIIHKYSKLGFKTVIYDTAKPEDETSDKSWAVFTENSKELFQIANTEDIALICTAQLAMATLNTRFLNGTCLAKSKAIKEVASQVVMIRDLWADEFTGEIKDVKAYRHPKDENGKFLMGSKEIITLDKAKRYSILFADKNRFGRDGFQLVLEKNLDFNTWREVGFATPHQF